MYGKDKSEDGEGGGMAPRDLGRVSVYLYVLVMGALFAYQTWLSVNKYLDRDVSVVCIGTNDSNRQ